jgi:hypothetical protein
MQGQVPAEHRVVFVQFAAVGFVLTGLVFVGRFLAGAQEPFGAVQGLWALARQQIRVWLGPVDLEVVLGHLVAGEQKRHGVAWVW